MTRVLYPTRALLLPVLFAATRAYQLSTPLIHLQRNPYPYFIVQRRRLRQQQQQSNIVQYLSRNRRHTGLFTGTEVYGTAIGTPTSNPYYPRSDRRPHPRSTARHSLLQRISYNNYIISYRINNNSIMINNPFTPINALPNDDVAVASSLQKNDGDDKDEDNAEKWELLYRNGDRSSSSIVAASSTRNDVAARSELEYDSSNDQPCCEIRVVSFDLDNTLWNTSQTIDAANDALAIYLDEVVLPQLLLSTLSNNSDSTIMSNERIRVEKIMGKLFTTDKAKYAPIDGGNAKSPVLLTQLRKDAIREALYSYVNETQQKDKYKYDDTYLDDIVNRAFDVWTKARHDAISKNLCPSTMYVMEQIKALRTSQPTTKVLIGAITDGNSNPKLIPELSNTFDFYINAEMVGITKPDKRIYIQAVKQVLQEYAPLFTAITNALSEEMATTFKDDDMIEELIGPWWVHIGDDFVKDIVASNELKMRNIWTKELLIPSKITAAASIIPKQQQQQQQQQEPRTNEKILQQMINENKIVEMSIGAETYLADTIQNEFATATVQKLRDVADIIQQWQNDALQLQLLLSGPTGSQTEQVTLDEKNDIMSKQVQFCIECGTKLPISAKFCSSCGQRQ